MHTSCSRTAILIRRPLADNSNVGKRAHGIFKHQRGDEQSATEIYEAINSNKKDHDIMQKVTIKRQSI